MQALYQRLKEIGSDAFEKLSYQILTARYPGSGLCRVDGSGGDRGLDLFSGVLADGPAIWQCKYFPNGVKTVQRRQVVKSLETAIASFTPTRSTLMVPVDLNTGEYEWFQKLQSDYSDRTSIELFTASDFVRELNQQRNIRDAFFPNAVIDTVTLLRRLEGTGALDPSALASASNKYLEEEIARLEEEDPRFSYRISYATNVGPDVTAFVPLGPSHIASLAIGNKRIDVFVRDAEAARSDPPRIGFKLNASGLAKIQEFYRTGRPQQLGPTEMANPTVPFAFALPESIAREWQVQLRPSQRLTAREHLLRVKVSDGTEEVQYDLVKFRVVSAGVEEMELVSISKLPFVLQLRLPLRLDRGGDFNYAEQFQGYRLSECAKAIRLKYLLQKGASVELYALELDATIGSLSFDGGGAVEMDGGDRALLDMAEVAAFFGWTIPFSGRITDEDLTWLVLLLSIVRGTAMPIDSLTSTVRKSEGAADLIRASGNQQLEVAAFVESMAKPLIFQGMEVTTGPLLFRSLDARFTDPGTLLQQVADTENEEFEVQFSVGEIYAERTSEAIRNLYVRPLDGTGAVPTRE